MFISAPTDFGYIVYPYVRGIPTLIDSSILIWLHSKEISQECRMNAIIHPKKYR